jgi:hypothetical protein
MTISKKVFENRNIKVESHPITLYISAPLQSSLYLGDRTSG